MTPRFAGGEPHDVAVERPHDLADALGVRESDVLGQMHRLAMRRNGDLRLQPGVHLREFGAARMAGDMDEMGAVGDDLDALRRPAPLMILPTAFSLPGMVREEKTTTSPRRQRGDRVLVLGDARQRGARLALAAGGERENLVARQAVETVRAEQRRHAVEIAAFARHRDDALHRAADHHDLPAVGEPGLRRGAKPRDVRGEGGDDDAASRLADQRGEVAATSASDGLSPSRSTLVESQISASTPSSPSSRRRALVGRRADQRRRVDLPVAGVHDEAGRRADRQRAALGNRMGDGDEFDVERADVEHARPGRRSRSESSARPAR